MASAAGGGAAACNGSGSPLLLVGSVVLIIGAVAGGTYFLRWLGRSAYEAGLKRGAHEAYRWGYKKGYASGLADALEGLRNRSFRGIKEGQWKLLASCRNKENALGVFGALLEVGEPNVIERALVHMGRTWEDPELNVDLIFKLAASELFPVGSGAEPFIMAARKLDVDVGVVTTRFRELIAKPRWIDVEAVMRCMRPGSDAAAALAWEVLRSGDVPSPIVVLAPRLTHDDVSAYGVALDTLKRSGWLESLGALLEQAQGVLSEDDVRSLAARISTSSDN